MKPGILERCITGIAEHYARLPKLVRFVLQPFEVATVVVIGLLAWAIYTPINAIKRAYKDFE
jgi:phage shock protein PspC (stress-responsive transcriptional regulator)